MKKQTISKPRKMGKRQMTAATKLFYKLWGFSGKPMSPEEEKEEEDAAWNFLKEVNRELEEESEPTRLGFEGTDSPIEEDFDYSARPLSTSDKEEIFYRNSTSEEYEKWSFYKKEEDRWSALWIASQNPQQTEITKKNYIKFKLARKQLETSVLLF